MIDGQETVEQIRTILAVRIEAIERGMNLYKEQETAIQLAQADLGREHIRLMSVLKALEGHQYGGANAPTTGASIGQAWIGGPFGYAGNPYPGEG